MAKFEDLVTELSAVVTSSADLQSFEFNELSAVDWSDRSKTYPFVLMDAKNISFEPSLFGESNLPIREDVSFTLHFFTIRNTQSTTTLQKDMSDLKVFANQYIAEVYRRNEDSNSGLILNNRTEISGSADYGLHSDSLVRVSYDMEATLFDTSCTLGTFS